MKEDLLFINKKHEATAETILEKVLKEKKEKYIIAISGESESGKSEISHCLGRLLRKKEIKTKIVNMDSFYKIPAEERREWRQKHGVESIGYEEYDWKAIDKVISDFQKGNKSSMPFYDVISRQLDTLTTDFSDIDILIINGLYSIKAKGVILKVFVEVSFEDTKDVQQKKEMETMDEWRLVELKREHEVILTLRDEANFFVDLDTSLNMYHL